MQNIPSNEKEARMGLGHRSNHRGPDQHSRANVSNSFRTPRQGQYVISRVRSFSNAGAAMPVRRGLRSLGRLGFWGECVTLPDRPWRLTALAPVAMRRKRPWQSGRQSCPACGVPACSCHRASGFSPSVEVATAFGTFPGPASSWPQSQVVQDGLPRHLGLPKFLSVTERLLQPQV